MSIRKKSFKENPAGATQIPILGKNKASTQN